MDIDYKEVTKCEDVINFKECEIWKQKPTNGCNSCQFYKP